MGLDLALGAVVLVAAVRGWLRGFVSQAVRIGGFVACFYLAAPVRDQARPYVLSRMPKVDPGLMDRILWWTSAAISYVVLVGVVTLLIRLISRPAADGKVQARHDDRAAGFVLGAAKGVLASVFLLAGVQKYAAELQDKLDWVRRATADSKAIEWNRKYEPAPRIWEAPPVRRFVEHIRRNGLGSTPEPVLIEKPDGQVAEARLPETPRPIPRLELPDLGASWEVKSSTPDFDPEFVAELERFKAERDAKRALRRGPDWR